MIGSNMSIIRKIKALRTVIATYDVKTFEKKLGHLGKGSYLDGPIYCSNPKPIFVGEHSHIFGQANYIIREGKFIVGNYTGIAQGLTVITGDHIFEKGKLCNDSLGMKEQEVVIGDDVRIGAFVTLLPGVHIGRGAIIGAGTVLRNDVPPYAIVSGNPAKVIGFRMNPVDILEHEVMLYPKSERLSEDELYNNYEKFYYNRMEEIVKYLE